MHFHIQPTRGRVAAMLNDPRAGLLAELHDKTVTSTSEFWRKRGGRTLMLPVTTGAVSSPMGLGSDSLPVLVELRGRKTYLADSMQFYLELGVRLTGASVYYVMPSFRGEPSDATHLSEFFHSEAEFDGDLDTAIGMVEAYLCHLVRSYMDMGEALSRHAAGTEHLEAFLGATPFPRLTFDEAADLVPHEIAHRVGHRSLSRAGELELLARHGGPFWLTHFDELAVPFYQAGSTAYPGRSSNADLIFGLGEVVGAGERRVAVDDILDALTTHGVDPAAYAWYLEMKAAQPRATSGFGVGLERFFAWVLGVNDIRAVQLLPRDETPYA